MFQSAMHGRPGAEQIILVFLNFYPNSHDKAITSMARGSSLCFIKKTPSVGGSPTNETQTIPYWARASRAGGEILQTFWGRLKNIFRYTYYARLCLYIKIKERKRPFYFHCYALLLSVFTFRKFKKGVCPLFVPPHLMDPPMRLQQNQQWCSISLATTTSHTHSGLLLNKRYGLFFYLYSHARTVHPPGLQIVM